MNSPNNLKKNNWKSIVVNVTFQCYLYPGKYSRKLILSILAKKKSNKNRFAIFCLFCIFYIWQKVDDDLWVFGFNHSYHKALNTFIVSVYYLSLVWKYFWKRKTKVFNAPANSYVITIFKIQTQPQTLRSSFNTACHPPPPPKKSPPSNFA